MIGYLGPEQSFTQQALLSMNLALPTKAYPSIRSLFVALRKQEVDAIMVPVENSTEGSVTTTVDLLFEESVFIAEETYLTIALSLYANAPSLTDITHVLSHPQALAQSKHNLEQLLGDYIEVPTSSTTDALRQLSLFPAHYAAVVGSGVTTSVPMLKANIHDNPNNATRFLLLRRDYQPNKDANKTSVVCAPASDRPGLLYDLLHEFAIRNINLTKIESRKQKTKEDLFVFYLDMDLEAEHALFQEVFALLEYKSFNPRLLGSYQKKHRDPA